MASKKPKANGPGPSLPTDPLMRVESVSIETVHPDPANVRRHPARNLEAIRASLVRFGQQKPIVVDPKGVIRAGNGTYEAAKSLGWPEIRVVRTDLAGSEATAYSIADNRSADLAEWDDTALAETLRSLQSEDFDLAAVGYEDAEVDALLEKIAAEHAGPLEPAEDPGPRIDHAAELQEKWQTNRGQLWSIASNATHGKAHRLLCGDSTNAEDVARLCPEKVHGAFTSPPYAEQRKDQYGGVPADRYIEWWDAIQAIVRSILRTDGSFFINIKAHCENGERSLYVMDLVLAMKRRWGWRYVDEFCWKHEGIPGQWVNRLKNQFEPIYHFAISSDVKLIHGNVRHASCRAGSYNATDGTTSQGNVGFNGRVHEGLALPGNVIEVNHGEGRDDSAVHPAKFPTPLPAFFIRAFSEPGDVWFDPFLGSGTTSVAAEQTGRIAYGMEISPAYCAVVLERLSGMGLTPELLA